MIDAFDVYLVMQLDSIRAAVGTVALLAGAISAIAVCPVKEGHKKAMKYVVVGGFILCALSAAAATLLPSSRTAAAMILLPAVTSQEVTDVLKPEVQELWGLTKDALKGLASGKDKPDVEKGEE